MEECLPLLATHIFIIITKYKAYCGEEVAFAGAIAADDDVALGRKGLDFGLVFIAFEALDRDLLDVPHIGGWGRRRGGWWRGM